jgi:PAS domain-containing protein
MKTVYLYLSTIYFNHWKVDFFSVQQQGAILYTFSIFDATNSSNRYDYQQICLTEAEAHLSASFFCLRASLDRESHPALIVNLESAYILSINLAAYELLGIDAVSAKITDFIVIPEHYQQLHIGLKQNANVQQIILLCNADGVLIECEVRAQRTLYCPNWAILYLEFNQFQPCFPRSTSH